MKSSTTQPTRPAHRLLDNVRSLRSALSEAHEAGMRDGAVLAMLVSITLACSACGRTEHESIMGGPYLGQGVPGRVAELFAPDIVSTRFHEHSCPAISPDGSTIVWTVGFAPGQQTFNPKWATVFVRMEATGWTDPAIAPFLSAGRDFEFSIAPEGKTAFFTSLGASNGGLKEDGDIWWIANEAGTWGSAQPLGNAVNTERWEQQPSVTSEGTLYYVGFWEGGANNYGIYRSSPVGGRYTTPQLLPPSVNSPYVDWTPFVAFDESYILFSSTRPGGFGSGDIYISYRESDNIWSEPINLGAAINTGANERYPCVSPDDSFLFFVSDRATDLLHTTPVISYADLVQAADGPSNGYSDIYWIDARAVGIPTPQNGGI